MCRFQPSLCCSCLVVLPFPFPPHSRFLPLRTRTAYNLSKIVSSRCISFLRRNCRSRNFRQRKSPNPINSPSLPFSFASEWNNPATRFVPSNAIIGVAAFSPTNKLLSAVSALFSPFSLLVPLSFRPRRHFRVFSSRCIARFRRRHDDWESRNPDEVQYEVYRFLIVLLIEQ